MVFFLNYYAELRGYVAWRDTPLQKVEDKRCWRLKRGCLQVSNPCPIPSQDPMAHYIARAWTLLHPIPFGKDVSPASSFFLFLIMTKMWTDSVSLSKATSSPALGSTWETSSSRKTRPRSEIQFFLYAPIRASHSVDDMNKACKQLGLFLFLLFLSPRARAHTHSRIYAYMWGYVLRIFELLFMFLVSSFEIDNVASM